MADFYTKEERADMNRANYQDVKKRNSRRRRQQAKRRLPHRNRHIAKIITILEKIGLTVCVECDLSKNESPP
jgi:hypothetical protein